MFPSRTHAVKRAMTAKMLLFTVFCCVSGGPFGLEGLIGASGPGLGLLLILIIPLLWAVPDALVTAELSSAMPVEGGYYQWVKRALGPFAAFLNGWWTWLYGIVDASLYPIYFAASVGTIIGTLSGNDVIDQNPILRWAVGFLVILVFTWINVRGTRLVGQTSTLLAGIIIVPFLIMGLIALFRWQDAPGYPEFSLMPQNGDLLGALAGGLGIAMWNYLGWDSLSTIAEEVEEPQKAYPRALIWGIPLVTSVYVIAVLAGLAFVPDASKWNDQGIWPNIGMAIGGVPLFWLLVGAAAASSMALFTATFLGASRLPFVMAEDGYLPSKLVEVHPKFGTPWISILFCAVLYAVLSALFTWRELISINVVLYGIALTMESIALVLFRIREPNMPRPFRVPGGMPVAILFGVMPFTMITTLVIVEFKAYGWDAAIPTLVCIASAPIAWVIIMVGRKLRARAEIGT